MVIPWTKGELAACKPPERITVSEWADRYRVLTPRLAAKPGPWRTSYMPYLRKIMDTWIDPGVEEIVLCKGAQAGASEAANNCLGYTICQDPGAAMVVYPTEDVAQWASENRLQDMIKTSNVFKGIFRERESDRLELQFRGMYVALTGANSPASLASKPVRYVIFDEIDKYPAFAGREANPLKLGRERTKTFRNRKLMYISTPTLETGNIWRMLLGCDVVYRYEVACPRCGELFPLSFKDICWPKEMTEALRDEEDITARQRIISQVEDKAWYRCPRCQCHLEDKHKTFMLSTGCWVPQGGKPDKVRRVGFHWNSIYSPQVSFGSVAAEFLRSKDSPEDLMNFVNSWLAEPFRDSVAKAEPERVMEAVGTHERGLVPDGAVAITAGVDIQKSEAYYVVRAWGPGLTSWLIEYGRFDTWNETDLQDGLRAHIVEPVFRFSDGRVCQINYCLVDCGYRTDEVYDACVVYGDVLCPVKGSSRAMDSYYRRHMVDRKDRKSQDGLVMLEANTSLLKDFIFGRMVKEPGSRGSWSLFRGCPREYAEQIASEHKVMVKTKSGEVRHEWRKISGHGANHLLDCEVYAALAARMMNLHYMPTEEERESLGRPQTEEENSWLDSGSGKGWFS
ncbi:MULTISPECIES: terminase gpA endonuclease subunit [Dethiosulfovibrio]|uniref:Phage terminase large subunit family protein n=2 Tax=Dethiosulfovibrio TaxID=47054 RepID=A0ABS9ET07_9BACT|nr:MULTISPECIES: terminase gpA endonuclease subunit [Dethiosulfovibrio]MCF4115129.1 phage terminase large subunit family protein [Dethiosulfovibrio russensis]MCF4143591.1 phage terminase large subunit family protein [Dethiosulfovibrio marinus]MCF4146062.1 phage terminase large subunit family protein [Dethiosulfovibrio acidaminovorans]